MKTQVNIQYLVKNEINRYLSDNHEDDLIAFEQKIEFEPNNFMLWYKKALCLYSLQRYKEALKSCEKAISYEPDCILWEFKGDILSRLNWYGLAIEAYEDAIKLNPTNPFLWRKKGNYLHCLHRNKEAMEAWNQVEKLEALLMLANF